jgi:hypothetical protein
MGIILDSNGVTVVCVRRTRSGIDPLHRREISMPAGTLELIRRGNKPSSTRRASQRSERSDSGKMIAKDAVARKHSEQQAHSLAETRSAGAASVDGRTQVRRLASC